MQTVCLIKIMERKVFSEHKDKTNSQGTRFLLQGWALKEKSPCTVCPVTCGAHSQLCCWLFLIFQPAIKFSKLISLICCYYETQNYYWWPIAHSTVIFHIHYEKKYMLYFRYWRFGFFNSLALQNLQSVSCLPYAYGKTHWSIHVCL